MYLLLGIQIGATIMENSIEIPLVIENRTLCDFVKLLYSTSEYFSG